MKLIFEDDDGNRTEHPFEIINLQDGDKVLMSFKRPLRPEECDLLKERWDELFGQPLLILNAEVEIIVSR